MRNKYLIVLTLTCHHILLCHSQLIRNHFDQNTNDLGIRVETDISEDINRKEDMHTSHPDIQSDQWLGLESVFGTDFTAIFTTTEWESFLRHILLNHLFIFTSIIAFNLCLLKLILFAMNLSKKESRLRDISCKAQRKVYYFEAEKGKLEDELEKEREKSKNLDQRMQIAENRVIYLENELEKIESERDQLKESVTGLESELEIASETGTELNKLLNDFLTSQKENVGLNSSIEELQEQIAKQANAVHKYEKSVQLIEKENIEYKNKIKKMTDEIERLESVLKETEHSLEIIQSNNEGLKASKSELNSTLNELKEDYFRIKKDEENYRNRNNELLGEVEVFKHEIQSLNEEISDKNTEIESIKEILNKIKKSVPEESDEVVDECDDSFNDIYSYSVKIQKEYSDILRERNDLNSKLEVLNNESKQLNERLIYLEENNEVLKNDREIAIKDKMKAILELDVLTKYYKEKDVQFGKEIGVQQIQRMRKEEDVTSLADQLHELEEENMNFKNQLELLKKQTELSESNHRIQIIKLEKEAHENWSLAKTAEKRFKESKAEANALREALTLSVKTPADSLGTDPSFDDSLASFQASLPPPPPPPPLPFLPPMPLHLNGTDPSMLWNQSFNQFNNQYNNDPNISFLSDTQIPPQTAAMNHNQWDSFSNRETMSPSSHRSNSSSHSSNKVNVKQKFSKNLQRDQNFTNNSMDSTVGQYNSFNETFSPTMVPISQSINTDTNNMSSEWIPYNTNSQKFDFIQNQSEFSNSSKSSSRTESRNETNSLV